MDDDLTDLVRLIGAGGVVAVTGAGMSTDSGVPDYRGSGAPEKPSIEYDDFVSDVDLRAFLWLRNEASWRLLAGVEPTAGHRALAALERAGLLTGVITQNVDRLHARAGSRRVAQMHGRFDQVVCLGCRTRFPRAEMSTWIADANPGLRVPPRTLAKIEILPPLDRAAAREATGFVVPECPRCGGMLKPDVVFFGEMLPRNPLAVADDYFTAARTVLVLGTSLVVSTVSWFVAGRGARPLAIVNRGPTMADGVADLRYHDGTSEVLTQVASELALDW